MVSDTKCETELGIISLSDGSYERKIKSIRY